MFNNLHRNSIIGYKKLSQADLGINPNGNQTHIGLYASTLQFITNFYQEASAQIIYENSIYESISLINPIHNPNGSIRSPKMRLGNKNELESIGLNSTAHIIRDITNTDTQSNWFILWFGLESEELIFLLFKEDSYDYNHLILELGNLNKGEISPNDVNFSNILNFINSKVNLFSLSYLEELELLSQSFESQVLSRKRPRRYDIQKAQQIFQKIGRQGEELVNEYLSKQLHFGYIQKFNWVNQSNESGFPFDFEITNNNGSIIYSDAKSTSYRFQQKIFFSSQELRFIQENNNYLIHRVFDINRLPKLKICNNTSILSHNFIPHLNSFQDNINQQGLDVNGMKVSVSPTHPSLNFSHEIIL